MNVTKLFIGALTGGLVYFFAGWLLYGVLFANMLGSALPGMHAVQRDPDVVAMIMGNLVGGLLLAYIFERWAGIRTFKTGMLAGAVIGFLIALSYDGVLHATTTLMSWGGILLDAVLYAVMSALAGGATAWALGYKRT